MSIYIDGPFYTDTILSVDNDCLIVNGPIHCGQSDWQIGGDFLCMGTNANEISFTANEDWNLDFQGIGYAQHTTVEHSQSINPVHASISTDGGNNLNWFFPAMNGGLILSGEALTSFIRDLPGFLEGIVSTYPKLGGTVQTFEQLGGSAKTFPQLDGTVEVFEQFGGSIQTIPKFQSGRC